MICHKFLRSFFENRISREETLKGSDDLLHFLSNQRKLHILREGSCFDFACLCHGSKWFWGSRIDILLEKFLIESQWLSLAEILDRIFQVYLFRVSQISYNTLTIDEHQPWHLRRAISKVS